MRLSKQLKKLKVSAFWFFRLAATSEIGAAENYSLVVQLTGRSANIFLLDANGYVLDALNSTRGAGQEIGEKYAAPPNPNKPDETVEEVFPNKDFPTLSAALNAHYSQKEAEAEFRAKTNAAKSKINKEIRQREKLLANLARDLENHGDADDWKRFGDLILANLATAIRENDKILVVDYFDENLPTIEIEAAENLTLTEAAESFFKRYTKSRNAAAEISKRSEVLRKELEKWRAKQAELDTAIAEKDEIAIAQLAESKKKPQDAKAKTKSSENFTGARRYTSSDDLEILVGKAAKDNDYLTFRVAKSMDFWMHAADYPGSHVVIRNPSRLDEIPSKTLLEAAGLAAFFSRAREENKVAVHYTLKKFVGKPKGAVAGLVSLSSFKTILVAPKPMKIND